jgi:hypothetical protein
MRVGSPLTAGRRTDKTAADADRLETLAALLNASQGPR